MQDTTHPPTFTLPTDQEITMTYVVRAPRELVWRAHTEPEHVRAWMLGPDDWTMPVCEMDVRPDGSWRWVWSGPEGETMEMTGSYLVVEHPERLVNTERWGGDWPETTTTLILTEEDGVTAISQSVHYPTPEAREAARATGMAEGWGQSYERLAHYLESLQA